MGSEPDRARRTFFPFLLLESDKKTKVAHVSAVVPHADKRALFDGANTAFRRRMAATWVHTMSETLGRSSRDVVFGVIEHRGADESRKCDACKRRAGKRGDFGCAVVHVSESSLLAPTWALWQRKKSTAKRKRQAFTTPELRLREVNILIQKNTEVFGGIHERLIHVFELMITRV